MTICVYGAASSEIDEKYIRSIEDMAFELAKKGHNLVFGAGGQGLMGAAARGFKKGGAKITGVIPKFFKEADVEAIFEECDELVFTETMRERKAEMEARADAFVIAPGGIGTFEEFFEILTLKQLGRHNKKIAVYNICGYYDSMENLMENAIAQCFVKEKCKEIYKIVDNYDELVNYLNQQDENINVSELKNG